MLASAASQPSRLWRLIRADAVVVLASYALSRLALVVVGIVTLITTKAPGEPIYVGALFYHWDSAWYVLLAEGGYSASEPGAPGQTNYAFYPLYPFLMWLLSAATGLPAIVTGVLISNVSFLAALFVLRALTERWSGDKAVARLAVILLCWVPEGFIFSVVYTESLFLLLTTASALLFERRQNFLAGLCAGLSSATRSNGVFVVIYFGLAIVRERGVRGTLTFWKEPERYLPIVMAPIGLFVFWWISMLTVGDAFAQKSTVFHGWPWATDWPWVNIVAHLFSSDARDQFLVATSLMAFAASMALVRRSTWPLFAYCLANFLLYWTGTSSNSLLRYAVALFPIYYGLALVLACHRYVAGLVVAVSAVGGLALMRLWVLGSSWVL